MDDILHLVYLAIKLGIGLCVAIAAIVFLAYVTQTHCWNPAGCPSTAAEVQQDQINDAVLRCYHRWQECIGNSKRLQ